VVKFSSVSEVRGRPLVGKSSTLPCAEIVDLNFKLLAGLEQEYHETFLRTFRAHAPCFYSFATKIVRETCAVVLVRFIITTHYHVPTAMESKATLGKHVC
jgi:hypothetical protein